jgi:O-acetylhomoserine (thiol)-lyase
MALHAGQRPDPTYGARAVPIYQTTSYVFHDTDHAAALFNLERAGHLYSRISNPTTAVLEERIAALEGGVGAVCTSSGQAALHLAVVDPRDPEAFRAAIRPNTRLLFAETLGNPGLEVLDIAAVSRVAHEAGLPLMVDNTFATPYLCRPLEFGADLVHHSITKFMGGHGIAVGGVVVDGGGFDWEKSGLFATLTEPYAGYHGIDYAEEFGPQAFVMRARTEGLRDFGACISPTNAFHILQGVETLPVRMERHVANARKVVAFLDQHDAVEWVTYPELPNHPDHELAKKTLPKGSGAIFSFELKGGREAGRKFIEALRLFSHLANVGDAKSLVIHPGSTTHQQLDTASLKAAGISEGLVRLSVGLEDSDDLIDDLGRGLKASQRG